MKKLTISRDSWHYKLAQYGQLRDSDETDLCRYWWALVRGVLAAPFLVLVGTGLGFLFVVAPLMPFVVWLTTGVFHVAEYAFAGLVLWAAALVFVGYFALQEYSRRHRNDPPGLVRSAYHGWKKKTCVLVEVR